MRSASAPPYSDIAISGPSSTAPSRPVSSGERVCSVELVGERDERRLSAEAGDEVAEHEHAEVARGAQRLDVDGDVAKQPRGRAARRSRRLRSPGWHAASQADVVLLVASLRRWPHGRTTSTSPRCG